MCGLGIAIWAVAGVTAGGAVIVGVRMYETHLYAGNSRAVPGPTPSVRARSHIYKDVAGGGKG